jgi:hypothetical protein
MLATRLQPSGLRNDSYEFALLYSQHGFSPSGFAITDKPYSQEQF